MGRDVLAKYLAMAERHIAEGEHHIARQRERVSELIRDGHHDMVPEAKQFLENLEATQAWHVAEWDRLRTELAKS